MEKLTARLSEAFPRRLDLPHRLADTNARDYAAKADWSGYRDVLRQQAKSLYRSKAMLPADEVPIGMIRIDGKYRFCLRVLRSSLNDKRGDLRTRTEWRYTG